MLILSLFTLQALSTCVCYDIELQGMVKIGNGFLNVLRQSALRSKDPLDKPKIEISSNRLIKHKEHVEMFRTTNIGAKLRNRGKLKHSKILSNIDVLIELMRYFQEKGTTSLNYIALKVKNDFNLKKIISPTLEVVSDDYANALQSYYDFAKKKTNSSLYDNDSVYLDFAETSCRLLYNEEKKLLNDVIMHENPNANNDKFQQISGHLLRISKKTKRDAIKYLCVISGVCRDYPTFTDFFPDVINEVLKLNDKKFRKILDIITNILEDNLDLFAKISENEDRLLIKAELKRFSDNPKIMKDFLELLATLMSHRFKIVTIGSEEFKMKTKAAKILLDIINRAVREESEIVQIDFDNFVQAIKYWAGGSKNDIESDCERFMDNWFRRLRYNLTKIAGQEIRVLIKTIMRGNTKGDEVFERLFNFGSTYVKGEDLHSDI